MIPSVKYTKALSYSNENTTWHDNKCVILPKVKYTLFFFSLLFRFFFVFRFLLFHNKDFLPKILANQLFFPFSIFAHNQKKYCRYITTWDEQTSEQTFWLLIFRFMLADYCIDFAVISHVRVDAPKYICFHSINICMSTVNIHDSHILCFIPSRRSNMCMHNAYFWMLTNANFLLFDSNIIPSITVEYHITMVNNMSEWTFYSAENKM